jgi:uncharacterized delta-60 repeat protein
MKTRMAFLLGCGLLSFLGAATAYCGPHPLWTRSFSNSNSNSIDHAFYAAVDGAGDVIVAGTTDDRTSREDFLTVKFSGTNGVILWKARHGGSGRQADYVGGLAIDPEGNAVIIGNDQDAITGSDIYVAKYARANGALLWEQRYDGLVEGYAASSVAVDVNGNVAALSSMYDATNYMTYVARYAARDGTLIWAQHPNIQGTAIATAPNGDVLVTGSIASGTNAWGYMARLAVADGAVLWQQTNASVMVSAIAVNALGDVIVTGLEGFKWDPSVESTPLTYYTAKYASTNGALLWERRFARSIQNTGNGILPRLCLDAVGNVIVGTAGLFYAAKYLTSNGSVIWERTDSGSTNPVVWLEAIAADRNGDVLVTGSSVGDNWDNYNYSTLKYAANDGALMWEQRYDSGVGSSDRASAIALNSDGDAFVAGTSITVNSEADFLVVRYASSSGSLVWDSRYNGPRNLDDRAKAVAFDPSGNVIVTGSSANSNRGGSDFYTAKYAATNGALLWERRYSGPYTGIGDGSDVPVALAIDVEGNVLVTGFSEINSFDPDYYTAKYAAADGALLWERRYNGPANASDMPAALVLDSFGNAIVTGASVGNSSGWDFYTAKYAGADGALLWECRYGSTNNYSDRATEVAVDSNGNVIVTGTTTSKATGYPDFYTAKYSAGNGALLWEQRYDGPDGTYDEPTALVVDAADNVIVTGLSFGTNTASDFYVVKYSGNNGTVLWETRDEGPGYATPKDITLDEVGNAVITGESDGGTNSTYTAAYSGVDGTVLWRHSSRYGGSAIANDRDGGVIVAGRFDGGGWNETDYYLAKLSIKTGAVIWEGHFDGPHGGYDMLDNPRQLAVNSDGYIAVAGYSDYGPGSEYDFAVMLFRNPLRPLSMEARPIQLRFDGRSDLLYTIERAFTVAGPWISVATNLTASGGFLLWRDMDSPAESAFYRITTP